MPLEVSEGAPPAPVGVLVPLPGAPRVSTDARVRGETDASVAAALEAAVAAAAVAASRASLVRCGERAPRRSVVKGASDELRSACGSSRARRLGVGEGEWRGDSEGAQPEGSG